MAAITNANVSKIVEQLYTNGIVQIGFSSETPLWSRMPKKSDFYETSIATRNRYGVNPTGSRVFATSRTNTGASAYGSFALTRARDYLSIKIQGEALKSVGSNAKRAVSLVKEESDSTFERAGLRMNHSAYRNAGGAICRITSGGGTQTITVTEREKLINIHPGMQLVSSNTDGTSGSVDANGTNVLSVDREAGTITTDAATSWDTAAGGFADDDYLFAEGDFGVALYGLESWIPSSAPSDTFLGQDRSLDPVYLGGVRYTASAGNPDGTIMRTLVNAAAEGQVHGARPEDIYMHPLDYAQFINEMSPNIEYTTALARKGGHGEKSSMIDVGISGIKVILPTGSCTVIPDLHCPRNVFWMLDMRTICFHGLGVTGPDWMVHDGGPKFQRMTQGDVDGVEATIGFYGNIECNAPGCNIRVDATLVLN